MKNRYPADWVAAAERIVVSRLANGPAPMGNLAAAVKRQHPRVQDQEHAARLTAFAMVRLLVSHKVNPVSGPLNDQSYALSQQTSQVA